MKYLNFACSGFIDRMKTVIKSVSKSWIGNMILIALIFFTAQIVKLQNWVMSGWKEMEEKNIVC
jgi:hypothetical protein